MGTFLKETKKTTFEGAGTQRLGTFEGAGTQRLGTFEGAETQRLGPFEGAEKQRSKQFLCNIQGGQNVRIVRIFFKLYELYGFLSWKYTVF